MASNKRGLILPIVKRWVWWPIGVVILLFLGLTQLLYQSPASYSIDVGNPSDEAYTVNFHGRIPDSTPTYRWSDVYGYVTLPGIGGSRPFTVTLTLDPGRSAPVDLFINGELFYSETLDAGWHTLSFRVDASHPQALQSRDTVIELRAPDYRTEDNPAEPKGIKLDAVTVAQDATGGFIIPAVAPLIWLSISLLLIYALVSWWASPFVTIDRSRLYGLLAAIALALVTLLVLSQSRIFVGAAASHIASTLASALLISLALEFIFRWRKTSLDPRLLRALSAIIGLALVLRFGGMALPQSVIVDMPYHMKWLRQLLTGDWQSLYFPGGLSAVPREWGMELLIPKSPLFYFAFSPLGALPLDLAASTKWLISLLDATVALGAYYLARSTGLAPRSSVLAALLYAVMPLAFRAFAYGILPTIFAQWLAMLLFVLVLVASRQPNHLWLWIATCLTATLTLLSFPTVAVFVTLIIVAFALILALKPAQPPDRAYLWRLLLTLTISWALAILAYYNLYITPVLTSIRALLAPSTDQASTVRWPGGIPDLLAWTSDYVVTLLPSLLALFGFLLLRSRQSTTKRAILLLALWTSIAPLFLIANYRFDMIGKHLFFVMLPVAVTAAAALFNFAKRGRWGIALASLAVTLIAWQGLVFWIERLVRQSS